MTKIVVIGGGHGQSIILKGIKEIADVEISAIVTVADDGGSTGRLRQRYHLPAMGDIRNVLVALSTGDSLMHELMSFRFEGETEEDVEGHSLGNLILTAISSMRGSFNASIEELKDILAVKGKVLPSSLETISLYARMDDDTIVKGEANIPNLNHHISEVFYDHEVQAYQGAVEAILEADLIIYGIGSLYTSLAPNTIIPGIREALSRTRALRIYIANCMTQCNETFDYDLKDHVEALEKHGAPIDLILKHSDHIPSHIKERYYETNSSEVIDHADTGKEVMGRELLDFSRNNVRHDPLKIKKAIEELICLLPAK